MSDKLSDCAECGMPCTRGEYHPHAACLMFKGCRDSSMVRAGLAAIREHALAASPAPAISESEEARNAAWYRLILSDVPDDERMDLAMSISFDRQVEVFKVQDETPEAILDRVIDAARKGEKS